MYQKLSHRNMLAALFIAAVLIFGIAAIPSHAATSTKTGWKTSGSSKYYYYKSGKYYKNCFATIDGSKYFFNEKGKLTKGCFTYKGYYYYAGTTSGKVKTTAGFVTYKSNKYYVQDGGKIYTSHTLKLNGKQYKAYSNGRIGTGVFKYGTVAHFYADKNGVVRTKAGFITYGGKRYYITSGGKGKLQVNSLFKVSGYTYKAYTDGHLATGVFKVGSYYYYASPSNYRIKTTKGFITYNKKRYYVASGGKIYTSKFFTVDGDKYYASATGAIKTGTFKVSGQSYTTVSNGRITNLSTGKVQGIDVSYFQYSINWNKVKASGVKFAIIRCGYRGSSNGKLYTDSTFMNNIKKAKAAGIQVGVYFFTEAINSTEGKEEADYCIKLIKKAGIDVSYPIVIDTENLSGARASSARLSKKNRTAAIKGFCDRVKSQGYTPMIYASTSWLNNQLDMSKLSNYHVWVAQYYSKVTYGGTYKCWQYSSSGKVNGISTRVDMDYWYN